MKLITYVGIFSSLLKIWGHVISLNNLTVERHDYVNKMVKLYENIKNEQIPTSSDYLPKFMYPPVTWKKQKGLFDSNVHVNFHGDLPMKFLRNAYNFPDENGFVTMFVTKILFEVEKMVSLPVEDINRVIEDGLLSLKTHQDKNFDFELPIFSFWNQIPVVGNWNTYWKMVPQNIDTPLRTFHNSLNMINHWIASLGGNTLSKDIAGIINGTQLFRHVFNIPSDADDTGCYFATHLSLQYEFRHVLDNAFDDSFDQVITKFYLKYSYKPFSKLKKENTIDPRTFIWIKDYLWDLPNNIRDIENLSFISTWFQDISEIKNEGEYRRMPFNVNNVDVSVLANSLFGITHYLMNPKVFNQTSKRILEFYSNNMDLLVWVIENDIIKKFPNMALLYYPSPTSFYWFSSRLLNHLAKIDNIQIHSNIPFTNFFRSKCRRLRNALKKFGTKSLLDLSSSDNESFMWWDEFLGKSNGENNNTLYDSEDRVFATATAINALLDIWTEPDKYGNNIILDQDIDPNLKQILAKTRDWLVYESPKYKRSNSFFSSSVKNPRNLPVYFPHNTFDFPNGTTFETCPSGDWGFFDMQDVIVGVSGIMNRTIIEDKIENQIW
jgi:hypothetical protein